MTAKTDTSLKLYENALDNSLLEDDEDLPQRYYDDINHYRQLRNERGDMPDILHNRLLHHLVDVVEAIPEAKNFTVEWEFNFYETANNREEPLYPDLFVFKRKVNLSKSYQVGKDGPPPEFILEIISGSTRSKDVGSGTRDKPKRYEAWGVKEYFAYDPRPRKRATKMPRLWGWRLGADNRFEQLTGEADGRMWSEELEVWLVPDGSNLRLYDKNGQLRLTKYDYSEQDKKLAEQREAIAQRREAEERRAKELAQQREAEAQKAKELAEQEIERLTQRLRELGDDPNKPK